MGNCRDAFERVSGPAGSHLQSKHLKPIEIHTLTHSLRQAGLPYNNYRAIRKQALLLVTPTENTALQMGVQQLYRASQVTCVKVSLSLPLFGVSFGCQ